MGRWEALVKIVEAFVASGRPGYGLLALLIMTVASLLIAAMVMIVGSTGPAHWVADNVPLAVSSPS